MNAEVAPPDLLARVYLFAGFGPDDLKALAALTEAQTYTAGERIFATGQRTAALYLVTHGTVDLVARDKTVPVMTVGSGQLLGELPFFAPGERPGTAVARETTHVRRIAYDALARFLAERPALELTIHRNACRFMVKHLQQMAQEMNHRYL